MSLLVADSHSEKFDKPPPPKKKWIQNYLEARDSESDDSLGSSDTNSPNVGDGSITDQQEQPAIVVAETTTAQEVKEAKGAIVQSVINQFQDYISQQTNRNQTNGISAQTDHEAVNAGQIAHMLDPSMGGEKFNDSLLRMNKKKPSKATARPSDVTAPAETINLTQKDIGGVVQGVISQFLNGSLSDVKFFSRSSSRKRCRQGHEKCPQRSHRHRDSRGHSHHHHSHRLQKEGGIGAGCLDYNHCEPHPKYARTSDSSVFPVDPYMMDGGVLNLSLPKSGRENISDEDAHFYLTHPDFEHQATRVTFAAEDSCYSTLSLRSMEVSKSQQMFNADEALDLGIKHSSVIAGMDDIRNHQNSYHTAFFPLQAGFRPQTSLTNSYIKPVPLSTLIVGPASLSPEVSPPTSPVSSPGPVNLIVKPTPNLSNTSNAQKLPTSQQMAVIQSPIVNSRYNHQYHSRSSAIVSPFSARTPHQPTFPKLLPSKNQYSLHDLPKLTPPVASSKPDKPKATKKQAVLSAPSKIKPTATKRSTKKDLAVQYKADSNNRSTSPSAAASGAVAASKSTGTSTSPSSSTRELHNMLEKNRRAQLKLCFEEVASECQIDPKTKASNLTVIRTAYKVVMGLRRDERENEKELAKLAQAKIKLTQRLEDLRRQYPGISLEQPDQ